MQSVSSRIWTRVAVSNSYDDNHYTTGTSIKYNNTEHIYLHAKENYISTQKKTFIQRMFSYFMEILHILFGLDSVFNGISTFAGDLMSKKSL